MSLFFIFVAICFIVWLLVKANTITETGAPFFKPFPPNATVMDKIKQRLGEVSGRN